MFEFVIASKGLNAFSEVQTDKLSLGKMFEPKRRHGKPYEELALQAISDPSDPAERSTVL